MGRLVGITIPALCLLFGANSASAQFGVKGGLTLSGIDSNEYTVLLGHEVGWLQNRDAYPQFGAQVGGFYTHRITRHFALQPELHFNRRGVDFFHTPLYDTKLRVYVYYVQVPLLIRYRMLLAGPYASVKLASRRSLTIHGNTDRGDLPSVATMDYGLVVALSPSFRIRSQDMILELRLEVGLANITDPVDGATELYLDDGRSRVLGLALLTGIKF